MIVVFSRQARGEGVETEDEKGDEMLRQRMRRGSGS